MELLRGAALIAATVTTGLVTGLLYGFACAVMPGLAKVDDRTFVTTFQRINVAIVNGWFLLSFLGALGFTALAAVLHLGADGHGVLPWTLAALVLYLAALAITVRANIPLNNQLAAAEEADYAAARQRFEEPWVRWNIARALAATAALGCLAWALVEYGRI
ncbi:MAG TPA: anthrone oxygenase family protein [Micromonosporaceae bacterium]|nr:anthrone oxygenase family protein [Micromonosporaceae bacterium]